MLILDEGYWVGTSCFERGGWNIVIACALFILIITIALIRARIENGPLTDELKIPYSNKLALYSMLGFGLITFLVFSTAVATARTRTVLYIENGFLVERGCSRLSAYEDRFTTDTVQMSYRYIDRKKNDNNHLLVMKPSPASRTLTVAIKNTRYPQNLVKIAPDAMRAYVEKAKELDETIPAAFKNL